MIYEGFLFTSMLVFWRVPILIITDIKGSTNPENPTIEFSK